MCKVCSFAFDDSVIPGGGLFRFRIASCILVSPQQEMTDKLRKKTYCKERPNDVMILPFHSLLFMMMNYLMPFDYYSEKVFPIKCIGKYFVAWCDFYTDRGMFHFLSFHLSFTTPRNAVFMTIVDVNLSCTVRCRISENMFIIEEQQP